MNRKFCSEIEERKKNVPTACRHITSDPKVKIAFTSDPKVTIAYTSDSKVTISFTSDPKVTIAYVRVISNIALHHV